MTVVHTFDAAARRWPDRAAFVQGPRLVSYGEAAAASHRVALALLANGVGPDVKVAVLSPNEIDAFLCVLGTLRCGAVWQSTNARNSLEDNIAQFQDFDTEVLFYHSSFEADLARYRDACPKIRLTVCIDRAGAASPSLQAWLEGHNGTAPRLDAGEDAFCMMFGTGGTTGRSKGVMLMHRNIQTMVSNYAMAMPVAEPPVHLVAAPMTHAAGFLCFWILAVGGTNVVIGAPKPKAVMEAIQQYRVSFLFLPPTVIYMMLADPDVAAYDYSSLRYVLYGAAPMAVDKLREALRLWGPVMAQGFGQVEAPVACTFLPPEDHVVGDDEAGLRRLRSCGRPMTFTEVAIMADDGTLLGPEQPGEIVVRGDLVMKGYYNNPAATAEASAYGWHHTGDIGLMDGDGYLYIVDRKKDMIITGGFNVFPTEIEQVIWSDPAVQDCAVIGIPDDKWGEQVTAVVEPKPGMTVDTDALIQLCKAKLGSVKAPKQVIVWPELPRSPVGKVLKRTIRESFWKGRDRAV